MCAEEDRRKQTTKEKLYYLLEDPRSSDAAYYIALGIVLLIIVSIIAFVMETSVWGMKYVAKEFWLYLEYLCTVVFSLEYVVRIYATPVGGIGRCAFIFKPLNIFDLLAIIPTYVETIMDMMEVSAGAELGFLRIVRIARVLRLFKLSRYSTWLQLVAEGMRRSAKPVAILLSFFMIMALISASMLFFLEKSNDPDKPSQFYNIPIALYWAVTTMTTVGYGEYVPATVPGEILGVATMFSGILLLALPVIVVGGNFQEVYNESEARKAGAQTAQKPYGELVLDDWDNHLRDLSQLIERAEKTSEATTFKARTVLKGLKQLAKRSAPAEKT
jgi:voltage-gated potassium channel Kch